MKAAVFLQVAEIKKHAGYGTILPSSIEYHPAIQKHLELIYAYKMSF
jgi:hypothetical protein